VLEVISYGEGVVGVGELVCVDSVEEGVGVGPGVVEGIANAHEVGVVLFGEGVHLLIKAAVRVDKGLDGGIKL